MMGIIKKAGDLVYTFRFLTLLTTPFEKTKAYELGIIDKDGNRRKDYSMNTIAARDDYSNYYTPFHRLVFNIKKLMAKAPGGGSRLASYAAALYLLKESHSVSEKTIMKALKEAGEDPTDILVESTQWFMIEGNKLSPGVYRVRSDKLLNDSIEEYVRAKDQVRVTENNSPVGSLFGINIYEATHVKTGKQIYITAEELLR